MRMKEGRGRWERYRKRNTGRMKMRRKEGRIKRMRDKEKKEVGRRKMRRKKGRSR